MLSLICTKKLPSKMQKEGRGEQNLAMNLETFNPNTKCSSGENSFGIQRIKRPSQICGKGVEAKSATLPFDDFTF